MQSVAVLSVKPCLSLRPVTALRPRRTPVTCAAHVERMDLSGERSGGGLPARPLASESFSRLACCWIAALNVKGAKKSKDGSSRQPWQRFAALPLLLSQLLPAREGPAGLSLQSPSHPSHPDEWSACDSLCSSDDMLQYMACANHAHQPRRTRLADVMQVLPLWLWLWSCAVHLCAH